MKALPHIRKIFWAVLLPVSFLWAMLTWMRRRWYPISLRFKATVPVLCIGNLHCGGSGKTPLVVEVGHYFTDANPIILSRGYRGKISKKGGVLNRQQGNGAELFGDEPWMLSQLLPNKIVIGRDRVARLKEIESEGRPVILDDGFQHLSVLPHCSIIVINSDYSPDDAFCLPLGELREPLSALKEASAVVLTQGESAKGAQCWRGLLTQAFPGVCVFDAKRINGGVWDADQEVHLPEGAMVGAFSGIAHPRGFVESLGQKAKVGWSVDYEDHQKYSGKQLQALLDRKNRTNVAALVTTEKDWFKVNRWFKERGERVLRLRIRYEIPGEFWYFLKKHWVN